MLSFQAALIDLDGTLVDSETLKARSLSGAVAALGGSVPQEAYKEVMGSDWHVVRGHFLRIAGIPVKPEAFDDGFRKLYREALRQGVAERAGARRFLESLRRQGKRAALVSSAARWMIEDVLQRNALGDYFDVVIGQEDVRRHKPDPEAYDLALARLGVAPENALVFEDSAAGIAAGRAAKCEVVAVRHDFNDSHDFSAASRVITSFDEITP